MDNSYDEDEEEKYRRDFGLFCWYSEDDVKWLLNGVDANIEDAWAAFNRSKFQLPEPLFINYIPRPHRSSVDKAIERNKEYKLSLKRADEKFDSNLGNEIIEAFQNQ